MRGDGRHRAGQADPRSRTRGRRGAVRGHARPEGGTPRRARDRTLRQGDRAGGRLPLHGAYRIPGRRTRRRSHDDPVQRRAARGAGHQAHPRLGDRPQHHQRADRARPRHAAPCAHRGLRHRRAAHRRHGAQPPRRRRRTAGTRGAGDHPPGHCRGVFERRAGLRAFCRRRAFRRGRIRQVRRHPGHVPRPGAGALQEPVARRGELHGGAFGRAHLARPRHGLRHRREGQGRPAVDAQCDLCGHRHRGAPPRMGRMDAQSAATRRTRPRRPRRLGQGPAADRKGGLTKTRTKTPGNPEAYSVS